MTVHDRVTRYPMLTATFSDEKARESLIREENVRCALSDMARREVRASIAREIGISPGTIENIRKNRFSSLRTVVRDRIYAWTLNTLQKEIRRLEHELQMALQCGEGPDSDEVVGAKAALKKAYEALRLK